MALILKRPLRESYITYITDEWVPFTAVIEMTALVDREKFGGNSLVYLPRYLSKDDRFAEKGDEEIKDEFLKALERIYSKFSRGDVWAYKVIRAKEVLPIPTINYARELCPPMKTSLENVLIVNSAQITGGTMNVNEIIGFANRKSKELVQMIT